MDIRDIVKAVLDGKTIQRLDEAENKWCDIPETNLSAMLNFITTISGEMRVKPKYRPYEFEDHHVPGLIVLSKEGKFRGFVTAVWKNENEGSTEVSVGDMVMTTERLLEVYKLENGQPAGVAL